jgi:hypothetical protein
MTRSATRSQQITVYFRGWHYLCFCQSQAVEQGAPCAPAATRAPAAPGTPHLNGKQHCAFFASCFSRHSVADRSFACVTWRHPPTQRRQRPHLFRSFPEAIVLSSWALLPGKGRASSSAQGPRAAPRAPARIGRLREIWIAAQRPDSRAGFDSVVSREADLSGSILSILSIDRLDAFGISGSIYGWPCPDRSFRR